MCSMEKLGINTLPADDYCNNVILIPLGKYLTLPLDRIRAFIPERRGFRSSACLDLLVIINCNPRLAITRVSSLMHSNPYKAIKNVAYLMSLGYVRQIGKPRLIIPFQRFKIDKGYVITQSGIKVLRELMS